MGNILTAAEVRKALWLDDDFETEELDRLSTVASSRILETTDHDFGLDTPIESVAKQLAILYCRESYFNAKGEYNKDHDYALGISSMTHLLKGIASNIKAAQAVDDLIAAIPATVTLADEATIVAARKAYTILYQPEKRRVKTLDTLIAKETALALLKV